MRQLPLICGVFLVLSAFACAEHNRPLSGKKLAQPPKIDGIIDETEWSGATKSSEFTHLNTGEKTAWDCIVYAGYDENNVYFGFVNPDPEPSQIRATETRRGVDLDGNDRNIILLNPFHNHRPADLNQFEISAGGGMKAEFAGGRSAKREWEGEWEAKSRITERGWECEVRIPWKILRLPGPGKRDIEINFARTITRNDLALSWCDIGSSERMDYNGSWKDVDVPLARLGRELLVLPYQIIGYDDEKKDAIINTGVDMRHEITPQITGLGSINPDFRNVEGAVLSLAFSNFERLAEEKRPFFVEGRSEFQMGGMSAILFAPQRIGSFDAGAKAFGKLSNSDSFGTLFTSTIGGPSAAVARWHRQWGDQGGLTFGTVQWDDPDSGIHNNASTLEIIQIGKHWGWDTIYNHTEDNQLGVGRRLDLDLMYRDENNFASVGWQEISSHFIPRIGFAPQKGFKGVNAFWQYNKRSPKGPFSEIQAFTFLQDNRREDEDNVYLHASFTNVNLTTRNSLGIELSHSYENFLGDESRFGSVSLHFPTNDPYHSYRVSHTAGSVGSTTYSLSGLSADYRFKNKVTISPALQFERLGGETDEQHIMGLSYEIDKVRSVGGRAVFRNGDINWYLAYKKSGNLGAEYYLIIGDPNAQTFQKRIILKAVIPVNWRL